jgi:hypothetical protein
MLVREPPPSGLVHEAADALRVGHAAVLPARGRGRPSWAEVLGRLTAAMEDIQGGFGGLPSRIEAEGIWNDISREEAHHSTAMVGNTLAQQEVNELLTTGITAHRTMKLKEYVEDGDVPDGDVNPAVLVLRHRRNSSRAYPARYDQTTGRHSSRAPADPLGAVSSACRTTDRSPGSGTNGTVVVDTPTPAALIVTSSHTSVLLLTMGGAAPSTVDWL